MVHAQDAGHGKDPTSPFSLFDFETLIHSALPLDSPGFMKRGKAFSIISVKTRCTLVHEGDVGIEKFHNRSIFSKKVMEKIAGLGTHGMQINGVVLDLIVNG